MEAGVPHLYENRFAVYNIAIVQLTVFCISLVFTYVIWWQDVLGIVIAFIGVYGASEPVVRQKQSFVSAYHWLCILLLLLCIIDGAIFLWVMLAVSVVTSDSSTDSSGLRTFSPGWWWTCLVLGSMVIVFHMVVVSSGIKRSGAYKAEMLRNPPPEVLVVYQAVPPVQQRMEVKAM